MLLLLELGEKKNVFWFGSWKQLGLVSFGEQFGLSWSAGFVTSCVHKCSYLNFLFPLVDKSEDPWATLIALCPFCGPNRPARWAEAYRDIFYLGLLAK